MTPKRRLWYKLFMTYRNHLDENHARQVVAIACSEFKRLGWEFEYDNAIKAWHVLTPNGWDIAENAKELWAILKNNR